MDSENTHSINLLDVKPIKLGEIITKETVKWWDTYEEPNAIHLIEAQTGKGKSHFVKYNLAGYAKEKDRKVLFLLNRVAPIQQFNAELEREGIDNVDIMSYQHIEVLVIDNNQVELEKLKDYYYIVCDECHYFTNDSEFNVDSEISLQWVLKQNKFRIFMSATMDVLKRYFNSTLIAPHINIENFHMLETIKDYSYFNLNFYNNDKVVEKLLLDISQDEKIIYFGSAKSSYELSKKFKNSSFICSSSNEKGYYKYSSQQTLDSIINNEMFEGKYLFTTKVLDNGVNIKDNAVKHIIADSIDIDTIIQYIGRKRIDEDIDERLNVYIRVPRKITLSNKIRKLDKQLTEIRTLMHEGVGALIKPLGRKSLNNKAIYDAEDEDGNFVKKVNGMVHIRMSMNRSNYMYYLDVGFIKVFCEELGINKYNILDKEMDEITLEEELEQLIDIKLFKDEQKKLKEIILGLLDVPKKNHNSLGANTINGFFLDKDYPYELISNLRENKGENRNKRYWLLKNL